MSDIDSKKIFLLKQEINKLLKERPELIELQKEIDKRMDFAGSQHNRCVIITEMAKESLKRLGEELERLVSLQIEIFGEQNDN